MPRVSKPPLQTQAAPGPALQPPPSADLPGGGGPLACAIMNKLLTFLAMCVLSLTARAAIIQFDLQGQAGAGLLPGNETGTGGEIGAGISFDDVTKMLTINVGWGTANGFTNLTGAASAAHVHGITASNAPASFLQNAGVQFGLTLADSSASAGYISSSYLLSGAQETALFNGQLYINVHTATNGAGEIRGQLIAVPEPSAYAALLGIAVLGLALLARNRRSPAAS